MAFQPVDHIEPSIFNPIPQAPEPNLFNFIPSAVAQHTICAYYISIVHQLHLVGEENKCLS